MVKSAFLTLPRNQKIIFISPHPDDDAISAGALLYTLANKYHNKVFSIYPVNSPRGVTGKSSRSQKIKIRQGEAIKTCQILKTIPVFLNLDNPKLRYNSQNIVVFRSLFSKHEPDIVFLPPKYDTHPTHSTTTKIILKSLENISLKQIWYYDTWTPLSNPNFIFHFNHKLKKIKINAIKAHKSQLERLDFVSAVMGLNTFRGEMGKELIGGFGKSYPKQKLYGEAFLIEKWSGTDKGR